MPNPIDLILLDAVTTASAGPSVGFGKQMRYGNKAGKTQHQYNTYGLLIVQATGTVGSTATIQFQDSPDGASWTTQYSMPVVVGSSGNTGYKQRWKSAKRYMRANVSAISGATLNAYIAVEQPGN